MSSSFSFESIDVVSQLETIDIDSSFVTIDSNRINVTFKQLFKLLKHLGGGLGAVEKAVVGHAKQLAEMSLDKDRMEARMKDAEDAISTHTVRIHKLNETSKQHEGRIEGLERRLSTVEKSSADMKSLAEQLQRMREQVKRLGDDCDGFSSTLRLHDEKLDAATTEMKRVADAAMRDRDRITGLYDVFEMDEVMVRTVNAQGHAANATSSRKGSVAAAKTPNTAGGDASSSASSFSVASTPQQQEVGALEVRVEYLHALPAFRLMHRNLRKILDDQDAKQTAALEHMSAKLLGDIATIRGRLNDKLDTRVFLPFEQETRDGLKKINTLHTRVDNLTIQVEAKADKKDVDRHVQHLQATKADRSEIIGMITRDDIAHLEQRVRELSDAFDALLAKINVDLQGLKAAGGGAKTVPAADGGVGMDPSLPGRVCRLETSSEDLYNIKADRKALQELKQMLDNLLRTQQTMLSGRPATPPDTPVAKRHGSLAPLSRPTSAKTPREPSPPPMHYTTTQPVRVGPNTAKYRATATLFDSEGHRTSASVTAARAVGNVEHLHNIARHVAGEDEIPADHDIRSV